MGHTGNWAWLSAGVVALACGASEKPISEPSLAKAKHEQQPTLAKAEHEQSSATKSAERSSRPAASDEDAQTGDAAEQPDDATTADVSNDDQSFSYAELTQQCHSKEGDSESEPCFPPPEFTRRLCKDSYPGVSIAMFEKNAPWTRGYVRVRRVDAINTLGGRASDVDLVFGEEVIILQQTGNDSGGMQVSGGGGYQVLRWDGSCATLTSEEVVTWMPGAPRHAPFVWNYIDTNIQEALLDDKHIKTAQNKYRKACKGRSLGPKSAACEKATERLNQRVVIAVRLGIELPPPERLP